MLDPITPWYTIAMSICKFWIYSVGVNTKFAIRQPVFLFQFSFKFLTLMHKVSSDEVNSILFKWMIKQILNNWNPNWYNASLCKRANLYKWRYINSFLKKGRIMFKPMWWYIIYVVSYCSFAQHCLEGNVSVVSSVPHWLSFTE